MKKKHLLLACLLFIVTAWFSVGHHQGDEHFQILEFAAYKLGMADADDLTWEFEERMRPALQPAMAYAAYKLLGLGGTANPFHVTLFLRLLSAAFTLCVIALLYRRYAKVLAGPQVQWLGVLLLFHWIAYYNGVRFSSENWSGLTAILGFLVYPLTLPKHDERYIFTPRGGQTAFGAGVLFGLAYLFRYQIALLVAGFVLWLLIVRREDWKPLFAMIAGGLLTLAVAYPLTYWLYGEWTSPAWNYLANNLIEGKAAGYGTRPWWGYLELVFLRGIPPVSILYILGTVAFCYWYRRDPLAWMIILFVVAHSVLARKDVRFLFPLVPLVPLILVGAAKALQVRKGSVICDHRWLRWSLLFTWIINLLLLASAVFRPAASEIAAARFVYNNYEEPVTLVGPDATIFYAEGGLPRFYNRPGTAVAKHDTDVLCTRGPAPCLYMVRTRHAPTPPPGSRLVFNNRPEWLRAFNFFGWQDREKWWYVYEVN